MKTAVSLEARLQAARPENGRRDRHFTEQVMKNIQHDTIQNDQPAEVVSTHWLTVRLQRLPKFALVAFTVASCALLGGTACALYQVLWQQPQVTTTTPTTNQYGRTQIIAQLKNCHSQTPTVAFEVKSGSKLAVNEVTKVLQARCELAAIRAWAGDAQTADTQTTKPGVSYQTTTMVSPEALRVVSARDNQLTLASGDQSATQTLTVTDQTQYVIGRTLSAQPQLQAGDGVIYVQDVTTKRVATQTADGELRAVGIPTKHTVTYVIKVDLPVAYYSLAKQNQVAQRSACRGNAQDSCVQAQRADIYRGAAHAVQGETVHVIQGSLVRYAGSTMQLRSSSGHIYTVTTRGDSLTAFNQSKSHLYGGITVVPGDVLQLTYLAPNHDATRTITANKVVSLELVLNMVRKSDAVQKY